MWPHVVPRGRQCRRVGHAMAVLCACIVGPSVVAQPACPPMPDKVNDVSHDFGGQIKANLGKALGAKGALGDIGAQAGVAAKTFVDKYPNADKAIIAQSILAMSCTAIRDSKTLTEKEKLIQLDQLNRSIFQLYGLGAAAPAAAGEQTTAAPHHRAKPQRLSSPAAGGARTRSAPEDAWVELGSADIRSDGVRSQRSACRSGSNISVAVSETYQPLRRGDGAQDHSMTLANAIRVPLEQYDLRVQTLQRISYTGGLDSLSRPTQLAKERNSDLLVAAAVSVVEHPVSSEFLRGDAYPLRTVQFDLQLWIVNTRNNRVLAEYNHPGYATVASTAEEAIRKFTTDETFLGALNDSVRLVCK